MEEELNENDLDEKLHGTLHGEIELEERLYALFHHVDATQNNLIDSHQNKVDATQFSENGPRSTLRRYWRSGPETNPYQKINITKNPTFPTVFTKTTKDPTISNVAKTTKDPISLSVTKTVDPATPLAAKTILNSEPAPKEERSPPKPPSPVDLSIFQTSVPQNVKKTIVFLDHEMHNTPVVLESSDEDEVVEVALPPKPTITIESSDEDEQQDVKERTPLKVDPKSNCGDRAVSASPVPSVVSSVSDEFIRGDCIALNISSRHPDNHSFDFGLHGSDLLGQTNASSKKKKRKKNKEAVTSTPVATTEAANADVCFATPKSKAKNKKQRSKLFTEQSVPNPDIYDSDSNLSTTDTNKNKNPYIVTEKSLPSVDVYESDSNQSEAVKEINTDQSKDKYVIEADSSDGNISDDKPAKTQIVTKKNNTQPDSSGTIDLTENENYITIDNTGICDSIVMGNVIGFTESMDYGEDNLPKGDISKYMSSKVPSILNDNLDFENLKGNEKVCKKRQYSLTTLRAEMEKFYNESWGGEDFNHKEIQKNMSRDKSLWAIDPKDRMQTYAQRKVKCNYCNRAGHRDDSCMRKPAVCYMCGNPGHHEPRCPAKICVNCGAPNFVYSTMCQNCSRWPSIRCAECGQYGHPASHCPDLWRRYHNTISTDMFLEKCTKPKKNNQQYCSGCAKRGHLVHACRVTVPFSGLPINSPHVQAYRPLYPSTPHPANTDNIFPQHTQRDRNAKRHSKSPTVHETHLNKKRNVSGSEITKLPAQKNTKETEPKNKNKGLNKSFDSVKNAPDCVVSSNHDDKGRVIQDNEVSDTSDAVTSARIYVTNDIIGKLKSPEGEEWLKLTSGQLSVAVGPADVNSFLSITGKLADQEVFQTALREWVQANTTKPKNSTDIENEDPKSVNNANSDNTQLLPKNRNNLLRHLDKALKSLDRDWGDPRALFRELTFSQNRHKKMMKQKVISPERLSHSRTHINSVLKSLNVILLGQAGLANGSQHLNRLITFQRKLMTSREKNIPMALRKEIDEHYRCIFTSSARNDYSELMDRYYLAKVAVKAAKKKKRKLNKLAAKQTKLQQSIPPEATEPSEAPPAAVPLGAPPAFKQNPVQDCTKLLKDMVLCNKQLTSLRKSGAYTRNAKTDLNNLLRRLHTCIGTLYNTKNVSSKLFKKVKKTLDASREFLAKA